MSRLNSRRSLFVGIVIGLVAGFLLALVGGPILRFAVTSLYQNTYATLVYECDSAMRGHLIAKMQMAEGATERSVAELRANEIALLACQDYDKFQKRLMQFGLSESDLSLMRIEAIERKADNLLEVIRIHEIRY